MVKALVVVVVLGKLGLTVQALQPEWVETEYQAQ
jgi:hypothetical protein